MATALKFPFPVNPGASVATLPPPFATWLPQDADINLVGQQTNCYVLRGSSRNWIVDPPSSKTTQVQELLRAAGGAVGGILITHAHPDHTGGAAPLAAITGAPVYAHPLAWTAIAGEFERIDVREGEVIDGWQVFHLPGHRFDHLSYVHTGSRVAVCGDLVAGAGSVIVDPGDGDLFDYLASLRRLRDEVRPSMLLPGHGPLSADPSVLVTHFITHRLQREQQVVDALSDTPASLASLLPLVYGDTSPNLYPLAERALLSHLLKLEREGRAVQAEEEWRQPADSSA